MSARKLRHPEPPATLPAPDQTSRRLRRKWEFSQRNSPTLRRASPLAFERGEAGGKRPPILRVRHQS